MFFLATEINRLLQQRPLCYHILNVRLIISIHVTTVAENWLHSRVLESKGCRWNITSPDHSVSESDVIEIQCEVVYASLWWTPVVQCLPDAPTDVASNNVINRHSTNATVMYRKVFSVTSRLNNVMFNCHVSFNSTSTTSSNNNKNAPADIRLWMSPAIIVKCKLKQLTRCKWYKIVEF